jgi:hypothetical protein
MILTGGQYAYKRDDGVIVVPLGCLGVKMFKGRQDLYARASYIQILRVKKITISAKTLIQ